MPNSPSRAPLSALLLALLLAATLAGCGEKKKDRAALTLAARVNSGEVSLNQINLVLQQQRNLRPDQSDMASRQILERLIDQTLAQQKAEDLGLDRDARVQLQLEAARREVLARAYVEKVADSVAKPTADELRRYYEERPALFRERRVFALQELVVEATPEQTAALKQRLEATPSLADFVEHLKTAGVRFGSNQVQRSADQLPPAVLDMLLRMKDGQASVNQTPAGLQVMVLLASRPQPLSEEAARPTIERLLLAERKRRLVDEQIKELRASARIEYLGSYADGPRPAASAASSIDLGVDSGTK